MVGQTIGKYRIVSRLGRGGMGTVYKAVDETLQREVAIKILNPGLADEEVLKRFRAEALALARLNHPNIATLFELGQEDDELLMVMEFVRGETFDRLSDRLGPLPFDRAAALCSQVLDALGHAHRAGIVHRDLKPANLMIAESGMVKVMDFGIARMAGTERLTTDGYMMGTPAYMAPEQVMGNEVDGRADLYAIGVVLYRLLTGNLPFTADTAIAMAQKQIKDPPTPLWQFTTGLPKWCQGILDRALAKAPHDRFQTAEEFRAALAQAPSDTESVHSDKPAQVVAIPAPAHRRRNGAVLAATATFVVAGLIAIPWALVRRSAPAASADSTLVAASSSPTTSGPSSPSAVPTTSAFRITEDANKTSPVASTAKPAAPKGLAKTGVALPPVVFPEVTLLLADNGKSRERDASLRLERGAVQVVEGTQRLKSAPYNAIVGIFHSRSKEPRWVTPSGTVVPVARVEGGKLSFFKGDRDWVTVRTRREFISLRTGSSSVDRVIAALEARTGLKAIHAPRN